MTQTSQDYIQVYYVDSFTNSVFQGNPAAVVLLNEDISDKLKKSIASELNLTETAFATVKSGDFKTNTFFDLRWFTPTDEVDLCGHATLATAAVIFHKCGNEAKTIQFTTHSGVLKASQDFPYIILDMPLNAPHPYEATNLQDLVKATTGELKLKDIKFCYTTRQLLFCLLDEYNLEDLQTMPIPSAQNLLNIENKNVVEGIIVTLKGKNDNYDFYSRQFAPWVGVDEDPVCGAAHTVLAGYWQPILKKKKFKARQCSKRGGDLIVKIVNDQRIELKGQVAHVLQGTMRIK